MAQFDAISKERYAGRSWQRYEGYAFARTRATVPLFASEMDKATLAFPIAFLPEGAEFMPVAMLSLDNKRNLLVAPDGRWLGSYVPAALRGNPFALLEGPDGNKLLCIDQDSGLLLEDTSGEPFFDETGEIAEPMRKVLEFLSAIETQRTATAQACAALTEAKLIVPWDVTLKTDDGEQKITGLYKIDEAALAALPAAAFETLRQAGAVPMAYYQPLSMQHLPTLGGLAQSHAAQQQEAETFMKQSFRPAQEDEISIDWSAFSDDSPEKDRE
jgi:hypothetical protein